MTSDFPGSFTQVSKPPRGPAKTTNWRVNPDDIINVHQCAAINYIHTTTKTTLLDDEERNGEHQHGWNELLQDVLQTHSRHHGEGN